MNAPFDCHACGRRIGKPRNHLIVRKRFVLCIRCNDNPALHAVYYPDCGVPWHDLADHGVMFATRAGAHRLLTETGQQ